MGGSAPAPVKKAKQKAKQKVTSAVTTVSKAGSNLVSKPVAAINKAGSQTGAVINKAGSQTGAVINKAVNQTSNALNKAGSQTGAVINKAGTQVGNVLEDGVQKTGAVLQEAYNDGKNLINKIIDIPNKLKPPKMGGVQQAPEGVDITDVAGRRKKRRSSTDVRSGLAATMLAKPQNLLGNAGGLSSNQGKAKLGQ